MTRMGTKMKVATLLVWAVVAGPVIAQDLGLDLLSLESSGPPEVLVVDLQENRRRIQNWGDGERTRIYEGISNRYGQCADDACRNQIRTEWARRSRLLDESIQLKLRMQNELYARAVSVAKTRLAAEEKVRQEAIQKLQKEQARKRENIDAEEEERQRQSIRRQARRQPLEDDMASALNPDAQPHGAAYGNISEEYRAERKPTRIRRTTVGRSNRFEPTSIDVREVAVLMAMREREESEGRDRLASLRARIVEMLTVRPDDPQLLLALEHVEKSLGLTDVSLAVESRRFEKKGGEE